MRDRPALSACATRPGHAVNMLLDERRSARHPGAASMQLHGTACHCRLLCQSLSALKSRATLAPSPPAAQSPGDARTCVSSLGSSWARS